VPGRDPPRPERQIGIKATQFVYVARTAHDGPAVDDGEPVLLVAQFGAERRISPAIAFDPRAVCKPTTGFADQAIAGPGIPHLRNATVAIARAPGHWTRRITGAGPTCSGGPGPKIREDPCARGDRGGAGPNARDLVALTRAVGANPKDADLQAFPMGTVGFEPTTSRV
jgi:hypothetical protein